MRTNRKRYRCGRQRGAILPFIAVGMLAIVGVAGLAIDSSNAFVNVTRLQNALDAAALSAAKTVNDSRGDTALATTHGTSTFGAHPDGGVGGSVQVSFDYSDTLIPWNSGGTPARFVRASAGGFTVPVFFAQVLPGVANNFLIGSTAVAGPQPLGGGQVCDIAPLLMCAVNPGDDDASDGTLYGLPVGADSPTRCLKQASHDGGNGGGGPGNDGGDNGNGSGDPCGTGDPDANTLEAGNFYLSRVNCPGGNCVRQALAGDYEGCAASSQFLDTEPGNTVGPVFQGLNTRFGIYAGGGVNSADHPADFITTSPMVYTAYKAAYDAAQYSGDDPRAYRRILPVPIADCAGIQNGLSTVEVLGLGCFFINQAVAQGGQNSYVLGQLIEQCKARGTPGTSPSTQGGQYQTFEIVLYNDPSNPAT